jgi:hypothetical protein
MNFGLRRLEALQSWHGFEMQGITFAVVRYFVL